MKRNSLILSFIAKSENKKLLIIIILVYLVISVLFSLLYHFFNVASLGYEYNYSQKFFYYLEKSFLIQTTVGIKNEFTVIGKVLRIIQLVTSIFYMALIPAIAIIKIGNPSSKSFTFCNFLVFYPELQSFRTRYVNRTDIKAIDINFDIRHQIPIDDTGKNLRNLKVSLSSNNITDARPMVSYYLRTKPTSITGKKEIDGAKDFEVVLHPRHLYGDMVLRFRVKCIYFLGTYQKTKKYFYQDILCGKLFHLGDDNQKKKSYLNKFNEVIRIDSSKEGINYCKRCKFRSNCRISNKVI